MNSIFLNKKNADSLFLNPQFSNIDTLIQYIELFWKDIKFLIDLDSPTLYLNQSKFKKLKNIPKSGLSNKNLSKTVADAFQGAVLWNHPKAIFNITPSPLLSSVAGVSICSLINPNVLMDYSAGSLLNYERSIVKHFSELASYNPDLSAGFFVSGGKITTLYGLRIGLLKCFPKSKSEGLRNKSYVMCSDQTHYTLESSCEWLGIGSNAIVRLNSSKKGAISVPDFEIKLDNLLKDKKQVSTIILNGGSTTKQALDDVKKVYEIRNKLALKYNLKYLPHIHLDSVIGWLWLYLPTKNKIQDCPDYKFARDLKRKIKYADSFGIDFHKTGLSPYISSLFIVRNGDDFKLISGENLISWGDFGENFVQNRTLEHSRPGSGIISSWIVLNQLGVSGMKDYVESMVLLTKKIRLNLKKIGYLILNDFSGGFSTIIIPSSLNVKSARDIYSLSGDKLNEFNNKLNSFYNILLKGEKGHIIFPYLGFVPRYDKTKSGEYFNALRFQTNSPFLSDNDLKSICYQLEKLLLVSTESYSREVFQPK